MSFAVSSFIMFQKSPTDHLLTSLSRAFRQVTYIVRSSVWSMAFFTSVVLGMLSGCATTPTRYVEEHDIRQLKVVFLDERSLHERWTQVAGRDPIRFTAPMSDTTPIVKTVRGFYDYTSNTLYCEKWNFEVCGHELHHAVLGQFHPRD